MKIIYTQASSGLADTFSHDDDQNVCSLDHKTFSMFYISKYEFTFCDISNCDISNFMKMFKLYFYTFSRKR